MHAWPLGCFCLNSFQYTIISYSRVAKWCFRGEACFRVWQAFYCWLCYLDMSWTQIHRVLSWHPWWIFVTIKTKWPPLEIHLLFKTPPWFWLWGVIIIIILYYRLAEHKQVHVSCPIHSKYTLSTRVGIQLLTSQWLRCAVHIQQPSPTRTNSWGVHYTWSQATALIKALSDLLSLHTNLNTVEPHLTVTSLVRKPPNYSHPGSLPNCIPQCK